VNRDEAKQILLLYRNPADAQDPQIAEALELVKADAELSHWFESQCAMQNTLREKFRAIEIPAALKEQIVSEQISNAKAKARREKYIAAGAIAVIVAALMILGVSYFSGHSKGRPPAPTLANYESDMLYFARPGYGMDLATNDLAQIKDHFTQTAAPADYILPAPLAQAAATGCAVKDWNGAKVSMICFTTGRPLPPDLPGDLWLFVVDRAAVTDAPDSTVPHFSQINNIAVATWTQNGKLYVLGVQGDEPTLRKYL
jgi:hypothetical protein